MELEKSLKERVNIAGVQLYDILYDENGAKNNNGLDEKTNTKLWDFEDGFPVYLNKVLSGRMSLAESSKDHMSIIEEWLSDIEKIINLHTHIRGGTNENE